MSMATATTTTTATPANVPTPSGTSSNSAANQNLLVTTTTTSALGAVTAAANLVASSIASAALGPSLKSSSSSSSLVPTTMPQEDVRPAASTSSSLTPASTAYPTHSTSSIARNNTAVNDSNLKPPSPSALKDTIRPQYTKQYSSSSQQQQQPPSAESEDNDEDDEDDDDTTSKQHLQLHQQRTGTNSNKNSSGGVKRPVDEKTLTEKKLRRLEKNRLSARECRRRKREATENLERQINVLEGENLRLRLQLQIGKEAEESRSREQEKLTQDIDDLLKSGASEADIYAQLEEFKEKHADYGKSRRSAIEFHLRNIERLLMPTQTTSFVLQAIQGLGHAESHSTSANTTSTTTVHAASRITNGTFLPDQTSSTSSSLPAATTAAMDAEVYASIQDTSSTSLVAKNSLVDTVASSSSGGVMTTVPVSTAATTTTTTTPSTTATMNSKELFQYLVNYLDVTPEQAAVLKDSRYVARELDGCLVTALSVLTELRERLAQTGDDLETEFNNVRSILTPTQAAKFLVWVANNSACMHMLNELWDRVYGTRPPPAVEDISP